MEKLFNTLEVNGIKTDYKVFTAGTLAKRLLGWMFRQEPVNQGLLLSPCSSIHTFFMRFDIDVVFLDSQNKVVAKEENIQPYKIVFPVKGSIKTLELPANSIKKLSIKPGDIVTLNNL